MDLSSGCALAKIIRSKINFEKFENLLCTWIYLEFMGMADLHLCFFPRVARVACCDCVKDSDFFFFFL